MTAWLPVASALLLALLLALATALVEALRVLVAKGALGTVHAPPMHRLAHRSHT